MNGKSILGLLAVGVVVVLVAMNMQSQHSPTLQGQQERVAAAFTGSAAADSSLWLLIGFQPAGAKSWAWIEKTYPSKQFCDSAIDHAKYNQRHTDHANVKWSCAEVPASSKWAMIGTQPTSAWVERAYPDGSCFNDIDKAYSDVIHHPSAANEYNEWRCMAIKPASKCDPDDSSCVVDEILKGQ